MGGRVMGASVRAACPQGVVAAWPLRVAAVVLALMCRLVAPRRELPTHGGRIPFLCAAAHLPRHAHRHRLSSHA